ncbi:hypothetical protein K469DRAFT_213113 [Zopfia rhizophila CBS 207.26]|uniref:F-box domain-containing protein n=1 Tax=Zopfia rhizophila CBS 207.26 TaxID=1314779 RepID=A0A6A6DTU5_9PEZI|nr:hypothetical protein K469DRAFT_213113 [Zopfia rhizophila CBS 207.26]
MPNHPQKTICTSLFSCFPFFRGPKVPTQDMLSTLPEELVLNILSHIHGFPASLRRKTLLDFCLTSKRFARLGQGTLYSSIDLRPLTQFYAVNSAVFYLLRTLLIDRPALGSHVQKLTITLDVQYGAALTHSHPELYPYLEQKVRSLGLPSYTYEGESWLRLLRPSSGASYEAVLCVLLLLVPNLSHLSVGFSAHINRCSLLPTLRALNPPIFLTRLRSLAIGNDCWRLIPSRIPYPPLLYNPNTPTPLESLTLTVRSDASLGASQRHSHTISVTKLRIQEVGDLILKPEFARVFVGIKEVVFDYYHTKILEGVHVFLRTHARTLETVRITVTNAKNYWDLNYTPIDHFLELTKLKTLQISETVMFPREDVKNGWVPRRMLADILPDGLEELQIDVSDTMRRGDLACPQETLLDALGCVPTSLQSIRLVDRSPVTPTIVTSRYWWQNPEEEQLPDPDIFYMTMPVPARRGLLSKWRKFLEWKVTNCAGLNGKELKAKIWSFIQEGGMLDQGVRTFEQLEESHVREFGVSCLGVLELIRVY